MKNRISLLFIIILTFLLGMLFIGCGEVSESNNTPIVPVVNNNNNTSLNLNNNTNVNTNENNNNTSVVTTITISPSSVTLNTGVTQQFTATVKDQNGATMTGQTIAWSVVGGIGTIDTNGLLTVGTIFVAALDLSSSDVITTGSVKATIGEVEGSANVTVQTDEHVIEIEADESAYTDYDNPDTNYGSEITCYAGWRPIPNYTVFLSFLKFDLSNIPSHAIVDDAKVNLYINDVCGTAIEIQYDPITESWDEDTLTSNNQPSDGSQIAYVVINAADYGSYKEFDIDSLAQDWIDGTQTNYGVLFGPNDTPPYDSYIGFNSEDATSNKPKLVLTVTY